ncbi:MAG: hypothetical protein LBV54_00990 [Puniceicoccales bacterium]|nr:hypothetical protein [Puniceicoccales bacterium]
MASFFLNETKQGNYLAHIHNEHALDYLSRSDAPGMSVLCEERILASNEPEELLMLVETHLTIHRSKAALFAKKFTDLLKARKDNPNPKCSGKKSTREKADKELSRRIKNLEKLVEPTSSDEK